MGTTGGKARVKRYKQECDLTGLWYHAIIIFDYSNMVKEG